MAVRYGPEDLIINLPDGAWHIDLDSLPPLVADTKGSDIFIGATTGKPTIGTEGSASTLAPLGATGPEPSEAECAARIQSNGTYISELVRGARFCVQSIEGRTAYIRVISAPNGSGMVDLKVTVWELPK
jgi:hypothetical protein